MHKYKELKVWQNSRVLVKSIYSFSKELPKEEMFGLRSQMTRAAISIASNISEGAGRETKKEFSRFVDIALGSAFELECQLILCSDLDFIKQPDYDSLIRAVDEMQKQLTNFKKYLNK